MLTNHSLPRPAAMILFGALAMSGVCAGALEITLPPDSTTLRSSDLPGYTIAESKCLTCHSTEYIQYQPATLGRSYWKATVAKMRKPFGAVLDEAEIEALTEYLVKTYGNERTNR